MRTTRILFVYVPRAFIFTTQNTGGAIATTNMAGITANRRSRTTVAGPNWYVLRKLVLAECISVAILARARIGSGSLGAHGVRVAFNNGGARG